MGNGGVAGAGENQSGYALLAILIALTLGIIALTAAAPYLKRQIQRDQEEELIHRGKQYAKAIQRYYKKFARYPASMEQLENTNNMRFLRKRYKDPITGSDEWRIIHFGEQTAKAKQLGLSTATNPGTMGTPASQLGASSTPTGSNPASGPFSRTGSRGQQRTFGGGAIVGIASTSEKESLKELDGKNHYNQWEFVYDPTLDPTLRQSIVPGQIGPRGTRNPALGPGPQGPRMPGTGPGGTHSPFAPR